MFLFGTTIERKVARFRLMGETGEGPVPTGEVGKDDVRAEASLRKLDVLGVRITSASPATARDLVAAACRGGERPVSLAFANAHTLNLAADRSDYRSILQQSSFVFNDGLGIALAARMKRLRLPANLNGSDFTPILLEMAADEGWPVYLLGARHGVAERAQANLMRDIAGLKVVGVQHGYLSVAELERVADDIRRSGAEVVLVGMGNPRQEEWLHAHLVTTGARLGVGVGAFLDFAAGEVPRAPGWMNRAGVEWIFRTCHEPRRLWRRYIVGNPLFVGRVVREVVRDRPARRERSAAAVGRPGDGAQDLRRERRTAVPAGDRPALLSFPRRRLSRRDLAQRRGDVVDAGGRQPALSRIREDLTRAEVAVDADHRRARREALHDHVRERLVARGQDEDAVRRVVRPRVAHEAFEAK
jgi:exopolysaccharide biosynthesis WecB/TagA/CpsF family protein